MIAVSTKNMVPLVISGLSLMASSSYQTFKYNDIEQNSIQIVSDSALSHLKSAQETNYGTFIHRSRFYKAYNEWIENVKYLSSPIQFIGDPNFGKIVEMGYNALPFIVEELEKRPSYLVWALNQIFGFKISDSPYTTIPEACKLWLRYVKSL